MVNNGIPKLLSFSIIFLVFIVIFLIIGAIYDKESVLLGNKWLLGTILYFYFFHFSIRSLIRHFKFEKGNEALIQFSLIPICWVLSIGLFLFPAIGSTIDMMSYRIEIYLLTIASHLFYLTGWSMIFILISKSIDKQIFPFNIVFISTIGGAMIITLFLFIFKFIIIPPPPIGIGQFSDNPTFNIAEVTLILSGITFFIGSHSKKYGIIIACAVMISIIIFMITGKGYSFLSRMRYDFIFFGPFLMSLILMLDNLMKEVRQQRNL